MAGNDGRRDGDMWVINGRKRWNSQVARAHANLVFARTSGKPGEAKGITAFIVPTEAPGHNVLYNHWTFNMPSDHAETELKDVRVPDSAILHREGEGLVVAQRFVHENRIRQAAASAGAARYCIRKRSNTPARAWPSASLCRRSRRSSFRSWNSGRNIEMLRNYIFRTAWQMDRQNPLEISDMVSICNFRANRLCCEAADRAMQVHGGMGYSRALPFEHIYRHHRRYRITEGSEEVQIRRVAQYLFGFSGKRASKHERPERRLRRQPSRRLSGKLARRRRRRTQRAPKAGCPTRPISSRAAIGAGCCANSRTTCLCLPHTPSIASTAC